MGEREDNVYKAKLAEQAERYDGKREIIVLSAHTIHSSPSRIAHNCPISCVNQQTQLSLRIFFLLYAIAPSSAISFPFYTLCTVLLISLSHVLSFSFSLVRRPGNN